jgi:hypothetical protein
MIVGICIAAAVVMVLCLRSGRKQPPLGHDDVVRLSLYSDKVHREELHPFE